MNGRNDKTKLRVKKAYIKIYLLDSLCAVHKVSSVIINVSMYLKSNVFECKLILFRSVKLLLAINAIKCVFK